MSSGGKGWVGSLAVHLGLLGAVIGFSWYAARHPGESLEPVDPLLIDLSGIPGKRPGEIGKAPGVAQGAETGTNNGIARIKIPKLNVDEFYFDVMFFQALLKKVAAFAGKNPSMVRFLIGAASLDWDHLVERGEAEEVTVGF